MVFDQWLRKSQTIRIHKDLPLHLCTTRTGNFSALAGKLFVKAGDHSARVSLSVWARNISTRSNNKFTMACLYSWVSDLSIRAVYTIRAWNFSTCAGELSVRVDNHSIRIRLSAWARTTIRRCQTIRRIPCHHLRSNLKNWINLLTKFGQDYHTQERAKRNLIHHHLLSFRNHYGPIPMDGLK